MRLHVSHGLQKAGLSECCPAGESEVKFTSAGRGVGALEMPHQQDCARASGSNLLQPHRSSTELILQSYDSVTVLRPGRV